MSKLEGREAVQVWRVKPPLWFSLLSSSVHWLTDWRDGTVFKEKRLSVIARVFIFRVFVKDTHRLAAVTVSCRPHKARVVLWGCASKNWLGRGSEQEVWSRARGSVRLQTTEEATISGTFIPASQLLMALSQALAAASKPFSPSPETPATPSFSSTGATSSPLFPTFHVLKVERVLDYIHPYIHFQVTEIYRGEILLFSRNWVKKWTIWLSEKVRGWTSLIGIISFYLFFSPTKIGRFLFISKWLTWFFYQMIKPNSAILTFFLCWLAHCHQSKFDPRDF